MSLAAAMTLDFKKGLFYRNARLYCINLLLTYQDGCIGSCAYCGLSKQREGEYKDKSFIRVTWPTYELGEIINRIVERQNRIKRICVSMITNERAKKDVIEVVQRIREELDIPISLLITPTIVNKADLQNFKQSGVDRIGIAIDTATPELFEKFRGKEVRGPHKWSKYWKCFEEGVSVFGKRMVGAHWIVGLGETEKEMVTAIQKTYDIGGVTHLFSFFPEHHSVLSSHPQPPISQYRRIQLARYLIDEGIARSEKFSFNEEDKIVHFGIEGERLLNIIDSGVPFMTSGCPDAEGRVACNRPYANSLPGPNIRNFPFVPEPQDIVKIKKELQI
jgi:biotin synthase